MRFRGVRQHPECTTCTKHKLLIRSFQQHLLARKQQVQYYHQHLAAQYQDRLTYYQCRGESRLRGSRLTFMADGMDQAKFCFPRHPALRSKLFANFQKPKAHVSGLWMHGRGLIFGVSTPDLAKDASYSLELLSHGLTQLEKSGVSLSESHLTLTCDNTSRELKNNVTIQWMSMMVSKGFLGFASKNICSSVGIQQLRSISARTFASGWLAFSRGLLRCCTMQHLRSGHSHEDLDQAFGRLAAFLVRRGRCFETVPDFGEIIGNFLQEAQFPFEPPETRKVVQIDSVRSWKLY